MQKEKIQDVTLHYQGKSNIRSGQPIKGSLTFREMNHVANFVEQEKKRTLHRVRRRKVFENGTGVKVLVDPNTGVYHMEAYFELNGRDDWKTLQGIMSEVYRQLKEA